MTIHLEGWTRWTCWGTRALTLLIVCASLMGQQPDTAYLKTKVNPGRAGVFVDGKYVGPAANFRIARKYALPPGQHQVKLVEPRYEEVSTTVELTAGKTTTLSQTLKPLPPAKGPFGMLRIMGYDKFAAVYVNDKFYGHAGEFNNSVQGVLMPAGEYLVRVEPVAGGGRAAEKVQIEAGKTTTLK